MSKKRRPRFVAMPIFLSKAIRPPDPITPFVPGQHSNIISDISKAKMVVDNMFDHSDAPTFGTP